MLAKINPILKEDVVEEVIRKTGAKRAIVNAVITHQLRKANDVIRTQSHKSIDFMNMGTINIAEKLKGKTLNEIKAKENDKSI
jgi:aspartate ammonia-lyase